MVTGRQHYNPTHGWQRRAGPGHCQACVCRLAMSNAYIWPKAKGLCLCPVDADQATSQKPPECLLSAWVMTQGQVPGSAAWGRYRQVGSWVSRRSPHPPPPRQPRGHLQRARQEVHEWSVQAGSALAQFPERGDGLQDVPEEALSTRSWSWGAP